MPIKRILFAIMLLIFLTSKSDAGEARRPTNNCEVVFEPKTYSHATPSDKVLVFPYQFPGDLAGYPQITKWYGRVSEVIPNGNIIVELKGMQSLIFTPKTFHTLYDTTGGMDGLYVGQKVLRKNWYGRVIEKNYYAVGTVIGFNRTTKKFLVDFLEPGEAGFSVPRVLERKRLAIISENGGDSVTSPQR